MHFPGIGTMHVIKKVLHFISFKHVLPSKQGLH